MSGLQVLMKELGEENYRAEQIFREIYDRRCEEFNAFTTIGKPLKEKLNAEFSIATAYDYTAQKSNDGTIKYLFKLNNGDAIESVLIPSYDSRDEDLKRLTLCVSSQVGCALDCAFCATGKLKLLRNLSAAEIVDQVLNVEKDIKAKITNIVFMGMGEPLQNFDNLVKAIEILSNNIKSVIARKRITVSTSGIVPKIYELAKLKPPVKLAVSLHATTNGLRDKLMPVNKKWKIGELREAIEYYYRQTKLPVTYEYILFKNLNDSNEDLRRLARFVRSVPSKINIIPFHDISFISEEAKQLKPADMNEINEFAEKLRSQGVNAFLRTSAGFDIDAACGQLAFSDRKIK